MWQIFFEHKAERDVLRIRPLPLWFDWSRSVPWEGCRKERPPDQHSCSPALRSSGPLHFLPSLGRQAARRAQRTNNNNIRTESRSALPWPAIRALRSGQKPEPGERERKKEEMVPQSQHEHKPPEHRGSDHFLYCVVLPVLNKLNKTAQRVSTMTPSKMRGTH